MKSRFAEAVLLVGLASWAHAGTTIESGPARVTLVELYTSEGCSSCPPAEKWLGNLGTAPGLWKNFVPVAFHVNYWDHLGWRDRLASAEFTGREHAYAAAWSSTSVYTPCFVRNGAEWRPQNTPAADIVPPRPGIADADAGLLTLTWQSNNACRIEFTPPANAVTGAGRLEASLALLGSGLVSNVRAGENRGRELRHDFVALRFATTDLKRDESGRYSAIVTLPPRNDFPGGRRALAGWITRRGGLVPMQAAGGWIE